MKDIPASSSSLYTHVNHPAHKTRIVYSVRAISSPVSFGRWVNTASISSLASDVVRVSASLNSWPSPVSTDLTQSCCGLGAYRVLVELHLLLLYRDGDDGLLWEVRGAYDVLWINGRSKTRSNGGKSRLKLLLLSHVWAIFKLSQMGCLSLSARIDATKTRETFWRQLDLWGSLLQAGYPLGRALILYGQ